MPILNHRPISKPLSFFYDPWFYFIIFAITNAVLSYGTLNFKINLCMAVVGWAFPMALGILFFSKTRHENDPFHFHKEYFSEIPVGWWFLIIGLAVLSRLYILLNSSWPVPDEGLFGFLSLELSKIWRLHFFFTFAQAPPFFNWFAAVFFKWVSPSIFSMRLFEFLLSIFALFLVYRCGRGLFSKSLTFTCLFLFAFSFWPLYISKFFEPLALLPIFEILSFSVLGTVLNSKDQKTLSLNGWYLGLVTGSGFWIAIQWPLVALMVFIAVFYKLRKRILTFYQLWVPTLLFVIPFLFFSLVEKNGEHIKTLLVFSSHGDILKRLNDSFENWTALFWGCDLQNSYGPVWGGMLNPITGALFFMGIFELIRQIKKPLCCWLLTSFLVFMIPGVITSNFEIFRNEQTEPLLLFICSIGFQSLIFHTSSKWIKVSLIFILFFSMGLDLIHVWKTYQLKASESRAIEFSKTFQILKNTANQNGPGEIYWGFNTDIDDPTLEVATYYFNAAENPKVLSENAHWVAFITNSNYKPFLSDQFPNAQFYWLGPDTFWNQGGLTLVTILKNENNLKQLTLWKKVNEQFHSTTDDYLFKPSQTDDFSNFKIFLETEKYLTHDRFLTSLYYEKLIYFQRKIPNLPQFTQWLKLAEQNGYPAAHLLVTEGLLWRAEGNYAKAEDAFKKALHSRLNLTDAQKNLDILTGLKKGS